jgi:nucleoside-diphosphate-sugar epimerase
MSFSPAGIATAIEKHIPGFSIDYRPDYRQQIADSWPGSIDDRVARNDWGWKEEYDIERMTADMLKHIGSSGND